MDVTLIAETGRERGSRPAGRLRTEGQIPGVVYGMGSEPVAVSVPWSELRRVLTTDAGLNALIQLEVDGESSLTIVKDLQRDPLKRAITHVDFLRIDADVAIEVEVPIVLIGEAIELGREGGIVEHHLNVLTVLAKPNAIPNEFEVDITDLTSHDPIKVSVIDLPPGVTTEVDPDELIVAGFIPRAATAEEEEAEGGGEAGADEAEGGEPAADDADND